MDSNIIEIVMDEAGWDESLAETLTVTGVAYDEGEEINGEEVLFDESWFLISEEELRQYELYGMFYITDGSVKGNWEVTVNSNQ